MRAATYTRSPLAYVTGGLDSVNTAAMDRDLHAMPRLDAFMAGGPLDAPDLSPTGRVVVVYGFAFSELRSRLGVL